MSTATLAHEGLLATTNRSWDAAITKLTAALQSSTSPNPNPAWLIARSKAFIGTNNFAAALHDAEHAVRSALGRGDKKSIIEAQHRRGVAYNRQGRLADADACCVWAWHILSGGTTQPREDPADEFTSKDGVWLVDEEVLERQTAKHPLKNASKDGTMSKAMESNSPETKLFLLIEALRRSIIKKLVSLEEGDEARKRTASMMPPKRELYLPGQEKVEEKREDGSTPVGSKSAAATPAPVPVSEKAELNIQSYESDTVMNATIFSKGVDKEKLKVHFTESTVALDPMKYPGGAEKECVISLNGPIKPSECTYRVTPSKVELKLVKAEAGKWKGSVGQQGVAPPTGKTDAVFTPPASEPLPASIGEARAKPPAQEKAGPAYPTSSRAGPKNWDKVVDLEDKDEDEDEGKDVNDFFKKLYKDATPEQQRAMMKSFTESNGTSLSTNWDEVGKGEVKTVPPEGVEAKKW